MKKTALLWTTGSDEEIMLDADDVEEKIFVGEETIYIFSKLVATEENETMLEELLEQYEEDDDDSYDFWDLVKSKGIEFRRAKEAEYPNDLLCYYEGAIQNLKHLDTDKVFNYYDGHNSVNLWQEEASETVVEYDDDYENLDKWDGSNHCYGARNNHAIKYEILSIDGNAVDDQYLIMEWNDWIGTLPTGKIVDEDWTPINDDSDDDE